MNALFRCDATAEIGFGHLSRCIALAEAFRLSATDSTFAGLFDSAAKEQVAAAGFATVDLSAPLNSGAVEQDALAALVSRTDRGVLVVDSYRAGEAYLTGLRALGSGVVVIDDFKALAAYPCDVVLNFTWEAPALEYPNGPKLLLGPEYFLGRRGLVEVRQESITRDRHGMVRNLLIAIGGSDPKQIAGRLVQILRDHGPDLCLRVVARNDHDLSDQLAAFTPDSRVLARQPDLSEQLLWADACITGGGLTKYESGFMGVPAAAVSQNGGQAGETRILARAGLVFDLGLADDRSDQQLGSALNLFLAEHAMRNEMSARFRDAFPADPAAHAASAILAAVGR
jgi:spore coat polysaccharide biosynthesis predicted glycosyltransferase SpsG